MCYVYIIESLSSAKWYYGSTENLEQRLTYHNNGWNRSTKGRGPWKYIFVRPFPGAQQAREFEIDLKKLRRNVYSQEIPDEIRILYSVLRLFTGLAKAALIA